MNILDGDALETHLNRASELKTWVWDFCEWGKEMLVFVACTAARRAVPVLEMDLKHPPQSIWQDLSGFRDLLDACEQWLASPDEAHFQRINQMADSCYSLFRELDDCMMELGGTPEENVFYAASACLNAGYAVLWRPEWVDSSNSWVSNVDAEREAHLKAGPAMMAMNAVSHARFALDSTKAEMKTFLASAVRRAIWGPEPEKKAQ